MNQQVGVFKLQPDQFEEIPGRIWPDREHTWRVSLGVEIKDGEKIRQGMGELDLRLAVLES